MFDTLTCFLLLEFFIPSCRTRFSSDTTSLQPTQLLFVFHVVQVCWKQILSAFVCPKMSLFYFRFWRIYSLDIEFGISRGIFFFQHIKMSYQCLLATISDEKLVVILIIFSLYEIGPLSHPLEASFAFKIFCFYLFVCSQQFGYNMSKCGFLCFQLVWSLLILYLWVDIFQHFWKVSAIIFFFLRFFFFLDVDHF